MEQADNPYRAPMGAGTAAISTAPSAWRYVPMAVSTMLGGLNLLGLLLGSIGVIVGTKNPSSQKLIAVLFLFAFYGVFGVLWLWSAWLWFRARYLFATMLSLFALAPILLLAIGAAIFALR